MIRPYLQMLFPPFLPLTNLQSKRLPRKNLWEKVLLTKKHSVPLRRPEKDAWLTLLHLWCLIKKRYCQASGGIRLFSVVAEHRAVFFNQNWVDYNTLRPGSLCLVPREDQILTWRQDYNSMRGVRFFGAVPDFDEILKVVSGFEREFNRIHK